MTPRQEVVLLRRKLKAAERREGRLMLANIELRFLRARRDSWLCTEAERAALLRTVLRQRAELRRLEGVTGSPRQIAGRKGGLIGGPVRALVLSAERRSEIARNAALARHSRSGK